MAVGVSSTQALGDCCAAVRVRVCARGNPAGHSSDMTSPSLGSSCQLVLATFRRAVSFLLAVT